MAHTNAKVIFASYLHVDTSENNRFVYVLFAASANFVQISRALNLLHICSVISGVISNGIK